MEQGKAKRTRVISSVRKTHGRDPSQDILAIADAGQAVESFMEDQSSWPHELAMDPIKGADDRVPIIGQFGPVDQRAQALPHTALRACRRPLREFDTPERSSEAEPVAGDTDLAPLAKIDLVGFDEDSKEELKADAVGSIDFTVPCVRLRDRA